MTTNTSLSVTIRRRKRQMIALVPAATVTITITTTRPGSGWMHVLDARPPGELRQLVQRDLDELVGQIWGGGAA